MRGGMSCGGRSAGCSFASKAKVEVKAETFLKLDLDIGLVLELRHPALVNVFALLLVHEVLDLILDLDERAKLGRPLFIQTNDVEPLARLKRLADLAWRQGRQDALERRQELALTDEAQVTAADRLRAV